MGNKIEKNELIYWAGLFDGEGYIGIVKRKPTKPNPFGQYLLQISLTQKNMPNPPISIFGGAIYEDKSNNTYKWMLNTTPSALKFLEAILPFTKIKTREIQIALEFGKRIQKGQKHRLSQLEIATRDNLIIQLKALKRGNAKIIEP